MSIKYGDTHHAIIFDKEFVFENVNHDFELEVQLYGCKMDSNSNKSGPVLKSQGTMGKLLNHVTPMKRRNKKAHKPPKAHKTPKAARPYAHAIGAGASSLKFEKVCPPFQRDASVALH